MRWALGLVIVAGAALRCATLDVQSLWFDEAVTAQLLQMDLASMLRALPDSESTPPLYYVLGWLWSQLLGTGEAGLRSLPALLGTATIPVVWALARRLGGDRAGLAGAALVAFNPMLIWFSQEARAYALLALLGALSALLWLRAVQSPQRTGRLLAWGLVAALALATHYFAVFLVAPQALWLAVHAAGARARLAALAPPAVAGIALLPLALDQRSNEGAAFIADSALGTRLAQMLKQFLVGYDAPLEALLVAVCALALVAGLAGLARLLAARAGGGTEWAPADARRLAIVAAAALVLPLLAAAAGEDHVITRNLLGALPLVLALAGAGLAVLAGGGSARPVAAIVAAACLAGLVAIAGVARDPRLQRDDWRGAALALGREGGQIVSATPPSALIPLRYYLPGLAPFRDPAAITSAIDYLALPERRPGERPDPPRPAAAPVPAAGFPLVARTDGDTFTVMQLRSATAQEVPAAVLAGGLGDQPAAVLLAPPR